jgi:hypothetical protein
MNDLVYFIDCNIITLNGDFMTFAKYGTLYNWQLHDIR